MIKTKDYESRHLMDSPLNLSQCSIPQLISHGIRYSLFSYSMGNRLMTMYAPGLHERIFMFKAECGKLIDYYETCKAQISIFDHRRIVERLKNTFPSEFTINSEFEFGNDRVNKFVTWIYELPTLQYEKFVQKLDSQTGFQWKSFINPNYQEKTEPIDWFRKKFRKPLSQRGIIDSQQLKQLLSSKKDYDLGRDFGTERNLMEKINRFHKQKQKEYIPEAKIKNQKSSHDQKQNEDNTTMDSFFSSFSYREFDQLIEEENLGDRFKYAKNGRKMLKIDYTQYMVKDMVYGQEEELNDLVNNLIAEKMLEQMQSNKKDTKSRKDGDSQIQSVNGMTSAETLNEESKVSKETQKKKNSRKSDTKKQPETVKKQAQEPPILQAILKIKNESNAQESQKNNQTDQNLKIILEDSQQQQFNQKQKVQSKTEETQDKEGKSGEKKKKKKKKNKHKKLDGFQENQNFTLEPLDNWKDDLEYQEIQNKSKSKEKSIEIKIRDNKSQGINGSKEIGQKSLGESMESKKQSNRSSKGKEKKSQKFNSQDEEDDYAPTLSRKSKNSLNKQDKSFEQDHVPVEGIKTTRSSKKATTKQEETSHEILPEDPEHYQQKHLKNQDQTFSQKEDKKKLKDASKSRDQDQDEDEERQKSSKKKSKKKSHTKDTKDDGERQEKEKKKKKKKSKKVNPSQEDQEWNS